MKGRRVMKGHHTYGVAVECGHGREAVAAKCSCGWQGPARHGSMGPARARRDADEHRAEVAA